jgi:hypothetical protein
MKSNISGIYKIENEHGEVYIGRADSKNGVAKRWSNHLARLRKGIYSYNQLQESWNKDARNLKWEVLEECSDEELEEREKWWIDYCNKIDGWTVINKWQDKVGRIRSVSDTTNMKKAQSGEKNGNSKISKDTAILIKMMLLMNMKIKDIAELLKDKNVTYDIINNIKSGLRWSDLNIDDYCIGGCLL